MNISFDALPLISDKMSGVGYCQAGLVSNMIKLHPEDNYTFDYFSRKDHQIKEQRLEKYMSKNVSLNVAHHSGFLYRSIMNFIPIPYSHYFGTSADVTHFFNYVVPPKVHGKTVVTVHDMVIKAYPETVRARTKYFLYTGLEKSMKRADVIVTDSYFSKSEIEKYYPKYSNKVKVVPCGVNLEKFHRMEDTAQVEAIKKKLGLDYEYFLYIGTIEPRKNLTRLIEGYSIFAEKYPECPKLVLAGGKGWLNDDIYNSIKRLNLQDKAVFTDYIADSDMCGLINGAMGFLFPSIYEGFGMPPLEAMACGVPVLTSHEASLPEVVGDSAVLVDAYNVESIAEGISKLYIDEELRAELSEMGLKQAKKYTWESASETLHSIYKELLNE